MEKNKTAVEWLFSYMFNPSHPNEEQFELLSQALKMEKEQIIGLLKWMNKVASEEPMRFETDADDIVEQYYNETYGSNKMHDAKSMMNETQPDCLGAVSGSYIIRIYDQDLCGDWVDKGACKTPSKYISKNDLIKDLKCNGLEIIKFSFSSFGACCFFEVKGQYKGDIKYQKLDTKAVDFCWSV
jgi:hypothetical protein